MQMKGTVDRVVEKPGVSKKTGKPYCLYSVVLDTDQGQKFIGTGFDKPNAPPGAVISLDVNENARGYPEADVKSIEVLREESAPTPASNQVGSALAAVDQRQRSIVAQSAYRTAVGALTTALESEVLKLPKAKSTANDELDTYLEALDRVAQHVFDKTLTGMEPSPEDESTNTQEEGDYDPLS